MQNSKIILLLASIFFLFACSDASKGTGGEAPGVLAAPSGLESKPGDQKVELVWNAVTGADSYYVYFMVNNNTINKENAQRISATETSFVHETLTNGDTYTYAVSSWDGEKESELSTIISETPKPPPGAPIIGIVAGDRLNTINLELQADTDSVVLYWSHNPIDNRALSDSDVYTVVAGSPTFTHQDLNAVPYYYVAIASNAVGDSVRSNQVFATPFDTTISNNSWTAFPTLGEARKIAIDNSRNTYTVGTVSRPSTQSDAYITKTNHLGIWQWTQYVFGSNATDQPVSSTEYGRAVAVDSAGNVYIAGNTLGDVAKSGFNQTNCCATYSFVAKYNNNGVRDWIIQVDSRLSSSTGLEILDNNHIILSGGTSSPIAGKSPANEAAFIAKISMANGQIVWAQLVDSSNSDKGNALAVDPFGNIVLVGYTWGDLIDSGKTVNEQDGFVALFNNSGTLLWIDQVSSDKSDKFMAVDTDANGNIYAGGNTYGVLGTNPGSGEDIFLAKYLFSNTANQPMRDRIVQFDSGGTDNLEDLVVDNSGNGYATGHTYGDMTNNGLPSPSAWDVYAIPFSNTLTLLGPILQWNAGWDQAWGITLDAQDYVYIAGQTDGKLFDSGKVSTTRESFVHKTKLPKFQ